MCRLLGVVVDREGEANADFADMMNTYLCHQDVPIGLEQDGIKNPRVWIDYAHLAYLTEADSITPMFACTINQPGMRPDGYRQRALPAARRCPVGYHDAGENQDDE